MLIIVCNIIILSNLRYIDLFFYDMLTVFMRTNSLIYYNCEVLYFHRISKLAYEFGHFEISVLHLNNNTEYLLGCSLRINRYSKEPITCCSRVLFKSRLNTNSIRYISFLVIHFFGFFPMASVILPYPSFLKLNKWIAFTRKTWNCNVPHRCFLIYIFNLLDQTF